MSFTVLHDLKCEECGSDLTEKDSVTVLFIVNGREHQLQSHVGSFGRAESVLQDDTGWIREGYHSYTTCNKCGERVEELMEEGEGGGEEEMWYVRDPDTGKIWGPFEDQDRACGFRNCGEGLLVFNEGVFTSREICVTGTIHGGVLDIDALPSGVTLDIRDYDVEGCTVDDVEKMSKDDEGRPYFNAG